MTLARATLLFVALTTVMTWPQATQIASGAVEHQDVYFNMWRFGWFAHALANSPGRLLDGNIFYPERRTLLMSDAMPLESLLASPLLWAGLPPLLVHNLMLLGAIVMSAVAMFALARRVTGNVAGSVLAGIVFAYAPYRFDHYMHMELQWIGWAPLAFIGLHRTVDSGRVRDGLLTGAALALQMLCSVYYGIFLAVLLTLSGSLLLVAERGRRWLPLRALAVGGMLAAVICGAYAIPYLGVREEVGGRSEGQVVQFSAKPNSYADATPDNFLYGDRSGRNSRPERRLFPGVLPCLLAAFGLLAVRPSRVMVLYLFATIAAFELSLGLYGYSYTFLYEHVSIFEGMRAPARMGVYVLLFLGVLTAFGYRAVEQLFPASWRGLTAAAFVTVLLAEYWVAPLRLVPYANEAPALYAWLARQPRGVVLELPVAHTSRLPGDDPRHSYMSTFHWMPLLNGYSGFYPESYLHRVDALANLPPADAFFRLRQEGMRYVIVHLAGFDAERAPKLVADLSSNPQFVHLGRFDDGRGEAVVFLAR